MSELEKFLREGHSIKNMEKPEIKNSNNFNVSESQSFKGKEDRDVVAQNENGMTKKTSSIIMGNNKNNIILPNGMYVDIKDIEAAMDKYVEENKDNTIIFVKQTGKKIDIYQMKEAIMETVKNAASIKLNGRSEKINNQETQKFSIKGEGDTKYYDKGVFMFGNNGMNMSESEYFDVNKFHEEFDNYTAVDAKAVKKTEEEIPAEKTTEEKTTDENTEEEKSEEKEQENIKPESEIPEIEENDNPKEMEEGNEIIATVKPPNKFKKYKKIISIIGLSALAIGLAASLIPAVMYANSILWTKTTIPFVRDILHGINVTLGGITGSTYSAGTGLWTAQNGFLINGTAASQSLLMGLGIHLSNGICIGFIKKMIDKIKNKLKKSKENEVNENTENVDMENIENEVGGRSL